MTCATDNGRILCVMIYNIAAHMKKEGIFFFVETAQATCVFFILPSSSVQFVKQPEWMIDNTVLWVIEEVFAVYFRFECRIVVNGGTIEVLLNLMYRLQVDYMNSY